jgi:acetyltransferase EpsM
MRYLVIGAAGHGQEVAWSLREQLVARGDEGEIVFFDDVVPSGLVESGIGDVVGTLDDVRDWLEPSSAGETSRLVLGLGLPRTKAEVIRRLALDDALWETVVHPEAILGPNVTIGPGCYVAASAVITVNAWVGRFVTVNVHCAVTHGGIVHDFATLHPDVHLSGGVEIERGVELGSGAVAIPGVRIGEWAVLGAGCVATRDLDGRCTWVGVPAREVGMENGSARVASGEEAR